jgi:general secretion pathway protein H
MVAESTMTSRQQSTQGFTLLELLVVMFLAAITIGVVATQFSGVASGFELKAESRKLAALLRHTRTRAISHSLSLGVVSLADGVQYQILPDGDEVALPEGIYLSINPGADEVVFAQPGVYFYPDGSSSGGTLQLKSDAGDYTVEVNWLTGEVALAHQN